MSTTVLSGLAALQTALATALAADATLSGLLAGPILETIPRGLARPYLAFAEGRATDWGDDSAIGARVTLVMEAVSEQDRRAEALAIAARAASVASSALTPPSTHALVLVRVTQGSVDRLKDNRGWRARLTIEALVETL